MAAGGRQTGTALRHQSKNGKCFREVYIMSSQKHLPLYYPAPTTKGEVLAYGLKSTQSVPPPMSLSSASSSPTTHTTSPGMNLRSGSGSERFSLPSSIPTTRQP